MHKIIFLEGVSGVGKTTMATALLDKLQAMGYNAICKLEGDKSNPLDPFMGKYPSGVSLAAFCETYLQCWRSFMGKQSSKDAIMICDGTFLHHQINDLIRIYAVPEEFVADYLVNLMSVIQPLCPVLFYLESSNVCQCLEHARAARGQTPPTKEQITFWENRKRLDLCVLSKLSIESHILNVDDRWKTTLETIISYMIK